MIPHETHLQIGSLLFEGVDQIDLTGPFEVLSRIPNSTYRIYGKTAEPVRDLKGLRLTPDAALADAPQLDVLHVPGGFGQEALMEDAEVLAWIQAQAAGAQSVFSVCTGALLCGAAGLLKGRRATTHWASFHLLPFFGAIPVNERVVVDGNWVFAAGRDGRHRRRVAPCGRVARGRGRAGASSFTWSMRRSRPSTAARPRPRRPQFSSMRAERSRASPPNARRPPGGSLRDSELRYPHPLRNSASSGALLFCPANVWRETRAEWRSCQVSAAYLLVSDADEVLQPGAAPSEVSPSEDFPMNMDHIRAFTAAMQRKDLEAMLTHMADDIVLKTPLVAEPFQGKAALRPVVEALLAVVDKFDFRDIMQGVGTCVGVLPHHSRCERIGRRGLLARQRAPALSRK